MALSVSDSSAITDVQTIETFNNIDPAESTAVTSSVSFGAFVTTGAYQSLKSAEVRAHQAYNAAIATANSANAPYLAAISTYQNTGTQASVTALASAYSTWQSALTTQQTKQNLWIAAGEALWQELVSEVETLN